NDINHMLMSFILEQIEIANNIIRGDRIPNTYSNTKYNKKNYGNDKVDISYFDSKY
ncbi:MAG: flagellar protein FlgN, partial [Peptostreptococcaceae bacterium]|nr:flagellar protein FlgN [Peptostreptococcaceae bacterium]